MNDVLLPVDMAATYLSMSTGHVRELCREGAFRNAFKNGYGWQIPSRSLTGYQNRKKISRAEFRAAVERMREKAYHCPRDCPWRNSSDHNCLNEATLCILETPPSGVEEE